MCVRVCVLVLGVFDLDVIVVLESVLHMVQEGEDVNPVQAAVQQSVHALERSLSQVQAVIHGVFERTHLHLHTHACAVRPQWKHSDLSSVCVCVVLVLTSLISSFLTLVSLYSCGRTESSSSRIRLGLLWAAELNVTKATRRTFRSGSASVFRKSPDSNRGAQIHLQCY